MPIGTDTLIASGTGGGFEPQRVNQWLVQITDLFGLNLAGSEMYLALREVNMPVEKNAIKRVRWFDESRTYAGSVTDFPDIELKFVDYLDQTTAQQLYKWRRLVWNPVNSDIGLAKFYKCNGILYLAPPNVTSIADVLQYGRSWWLQGIWPSDLNMGQLNMENDGDPVIISCTLACDRAYPGNAAGGGDPTMAGPHYMDTAGL